MQVFKNLVGGIWVESDEFHLVRNPWDQSEVSRFCMAKPDQIQTALESAHTAKRQFKNSSRYLRARLLHTVLDLLKAKKDEFVNSIISESGKPVSLAAGEFARCLNTFQTAAEEVTKFTGESYPMDIDSTTRVFGNGITEFVPKGIIFAITPFNFPLNLVAHKVAPALAVGAPVILKPAPQAPGAAFMLGEVVREAIEMVNRESGTDSDQIPGSALQVIFCSHENASLITKDPRIAIVSFTGSPKVGWYLQEQAIKKKVLLELGGNAGVLVAKDADLNLAAARIAFGATSYSGQSCISVQRIFVEKEVYSKLKDLLIQEFQKIAYGDPKDPSTIAGPVIDTAAKNRIMDWISEASQAGGRILVGGKSEGNLIEPTLMENPPRDSKLCSEEVFGPVAVLNSVADFREGLEAINDSKYGLHAGIFTYDLKKIQSAFQDLEVGGLIVNEVPTFRADHMPYGGVKESGLGREGVRYAMEDFCERKTMVIKK
jgi:glyceraldehyde-3-phosphate dehydrogenase (NADP+)